MQLEGGDGVPFSVVRMPHIVDSWLEAIQIGEDISPKLAKKFSVVPNFVHDT